MERDGEVTYFNGPQRHPWVGTIFVNYYFPALEKSQEFAKAVKGLYVLDKQFHCTRQAFAMNCEKILARQWLAANNLSLAIFEHYQSPLHDEAGKVKNVRSVFPSAVIVFVSPFPEHMNVGADVHVGVLDSKINFGSKEKNFAKRIAIQDNADICINGYEQLFALAKYDLLAHSLTECQQIIKNFQRRRQLKIFDQECREGK